MLTSAKRLGRASARAGGRRPDECDVNCLPSLANNISNLLPLVFASVLRYDALKCIYDVPCIPVTFGM